METVIKKISLEPFYSRQKSTIPFVGYVPGEEYPSLNWGKIAYGVDFPRLVGSGTQMQEAVNAYGIGVKKLGSMTFREIMDMYHEAVNGKVYLVDEPTEEEQDEIDKYRSIVAFVDAHKVIDMPQPVFDPCCDPCPSQPKPQMYDIDSGNFYTIPYAYCNLCLVQSANLIGSYTFATKDWIPGKKYYAGDKVIYDGKTFKLRDFNQGTVFYGSKSNCEGRKLMKARYLTASNPADFVMYGDEYEGLSDDPFKDFTVNDTSEMVDMGYIYAKIGSGDNWTYYIRPSWGGFTNRWDGKTYFDNLRNPMDPDAGFVMRGVYDTEHWVIADDIVSHGVYEVTTHNKNVHIRTQQNRSIGYDNVVIPGIRSESKLVNFMRNTKTMTLGGFELPGKLLSNRTSTVMDLQYIAGAVRNVDTTGDIPIGDYLVSISLYNTNGGLIHTIVPGESLENVGITLSTRGKIVFLYYIGADLVFDNSINNYKYNGGNKGLVYKDTYDYVVSMYPNASQLPEEQRIENRESGFMYVDIDYDSAKGYVKYENIDNYKDWVILSDVTATTKSMTEGGDPVSPNFQNADYFMEDYQLGISFVSNNNSNVYVDRGTATAFERHMRLSEVDTLQDLEDYGNGMFKLKE